MDHEHSLMACNSISHYSQQCFAAIAENSTEPHVLFRPSLSVDGNQWCALYGDDLQSGVAGFGDTPEKAMWDFDRNWRKPLRDSPSGIALAARVKP